MNLLKTYENFHLTSSLPPSGAALYGKTFEHVNPSYGYSIFDFDYMIQDNPIQSDRLTRAPRKFSMAECMRYSGMIKASCCRRISSVTVSCHDFTLAIRSTVPLAVWWLSLINISFRSRREIGFGLCKAEFSYTHFAILIFPNCCRSARYWKNEYSERVYENSAFAERHAQLVAANGTILRQQNTLSNSELNITPGVLANGSSILVDIIPESPRWLVSVGRHAEAINIIKRLAKINGRNDVDVDDLMARVELVAESMTKNWLSWLRKFTRNCDLTIHSNVYNLFDLFRTPNLRKKTVLITYIWFVNAVVYNCLTYNISNLPVNDFLSFIINGAVELPAYFLVWPLLDAVGRRWSLAGPMIIAGLACVSTIFTSISQGELSWVVLYELWSAELNWADHPLFIAIMAYVGKFGIAGSFAVIYLFSGELYPTVLRAIGMGMSSMVAGSGLILAPYVVRLVRS
ncbi:Organic cation transporter 1 [Dirofilaria immitis]|nr:Organic cation transporter 1 [Dirofilaria immitis]